MQRTAQDVEELTKDVNVEGKRDALLASSAAAEEATKVCSWGGVHVQSWSAGAVDGWRCMPSSWSPSTRTCSWCVSVVSLSLTRCRTPSVMCRRERRWKTS